MYELIFTSLVFTTTGLPTFQVEHISLFRELAVCEKTKDSLVSYMDQLVKENKMFPGVFECRKKT